MAWLKDAAVHSTHGSVSALAAAAVGHAKWPGPTNAGSVRNKINDVDSGESVSWLADNPGRVQVFADLLGIPPEDLQKSVRQLVVVASTERLFRLDDLPADAAPLNLREEGLFPGIPAVVSEPTWWVSPVWWTTRPGAGERVVEAWLRARDVVVVRCAVASDALVRVSRQPLFIVAASASGAADLLQAAIDARCPICVACDAGPPEPEAGRPGWGEAEIDERWAGALVGWVARRLSAKSFLRQPGQVEKAVSFVDGAPHAFQTPADVFTFCSLVDEQSLEGLEDGNAGGFAWSLLTRRVGDDDHLGKWLRDCGAELLTNLAMRLSGDPEVWLGILDLTAEGVTREVWQDLLGPATPRGADPNALREALERGKKCSPSEVSHLLAPREPREIVDRLIRSGLLCRAMDGRWVWRFAWVLSVFGMDWLRRAPEWPSQHWGQALLRPWSTAVLYKVLGHELTKDWTLARRALASFDPLDVASVAFLEACFRNVGLIIARGEAAPPPDLVAGLWRAQRQTLERWYDEGWPPLPRVGHAADRARVERLGDRAFIAAAAMLAEACEDKDPVEPDLWLDPTQHHPAWLAAAIERVTWFKNSEPDGEPLPWAEGWFNFVSSLVERCPAVLDHAKPSAFSLLQVFCGVRAIGRGETPDPRGTTWPGVPYAWVERACAQAGVDVARVIELAWEQEPLSPGLGRWWAGVLEQDDDFAAEQWAAAPGAAILRAVLRGEERELPVERMDAAQWRELMKAQWDPSSEHPLLSRVPWAVMESWLDSGDVWMLTSRGMVEAMWEHHPTATRARVERCDDLTRRPWTDLLAAAPPEVLLDLADREPHRQIVRRVILHRVGNRGPGWRELWPVLAGAA